ncbi:hypothetical protein [Aestuariivirga sp.]|uniref:hypothetical protein n=1 Tax=Aestuariivirga sp. TaxID=2650926 RepID=UPI003918EE00
MADLADISKIIRQRDASIAINIVTPRDTADAVPKERWQFKSITVAFCRSRRFVPPRGPIFECRAIPKLEQYGRFLAGGIATPRTERFVVGRAYDPELWSPYVILKPLPLDVTSRAGSAKLYRTARLATVNPASLTPEHPLSSGPALVQEFIDTGFHPYKWRVLSFLGEPLYCSITRSAVPRAPLDADDETLEASIVDAKNEASKAADTEGQRNALVLDQAVLAFARSIHRLFPRRTLLGIDILKRVPDGKLFAIEVNAGGNVWHFSSPKQGHRKRLGGKSAMIAQLDAWNVAATRLIDLARGEAS